MANPVYETKPQRKVWYKRMKGIDTKKSVGVLLMSFPPLRLSHCLFPKSKRIKNYVLRIMRAYLIMDYELTDKPDTSGFEQTDRGRGDKGLSRHPLSFLPYILC